MDVDGGWGRCDGLVDHIVVSLHVVAFEPTWIYGESCVDYERAVVSVFSGVGAQIADVAFWQFDAL